MMSPSTQSLRRLAAPSIAALLLLPAPADASSTSPRVLFHPARQDYALGVYGRFDLGDLNGDGIPDLVAPSSSRTVAVLLGRADGTFGDPVDSENTWWPHEVALGDLDGDEALDVAVGTSSGLVILLGDGYGALGSPAEYYTGWRGESLALADFDGDGDLDIAITSDDGLVVYLNDGDATLAGPFYYPAGVFPRDVETADLNLDEIPDLVVAAQESHETDVYVLLGVGDGTFLSAMTYAAGGPPRYLDIGDLDGDPFPDVAVSNWPERTLSVLFGVGGGALSPPQTIALVDAPLHVAIGDLNEDGAQDLVGTCRMSYPNSGGIWLVPGDGIGGFGEPRFLPTQYDPDAVRFLDLTGDGYTDLLTAGSYFSTFPGNGTLDVGAPRYPTLGRGGVDMVCDRFDGDGVPDLVVLTRGPKIAVESRESATSGRSRTGTICFLRGLGDGSFAEAAAAGRVFGEPSTFAQGDFDDNGTLDLVVVEDGPDQAGIWLGGGDGTFVRHAGHGAGQNPRRVAVGHLDGDDLLDIVATSESNIGVLFGAGGGSFEPAEFLPGGDAYRLVLADVDDDGALDIVVLIEVNHAVGRLDVLYGAGDGTFPHTRTLPLPGKPWDVDVVDLDADGRTDVVTVISHPAPGLYVLWRTAGGDYHGERYSAEANYNWVALSSMAVGDVSGDGRLDVLTVRRFQLERINVFLGASAHQSSRALRLLDLGYGAGHYPEAIVLDDLDGDGDLDVATANRGTRDVSVLLGTVAPDLEADPVLWSPPGSRTGIDAAVDAGAVGLGRPYPSPFRAGTSVPFVLPGDARVRVSIFDVSGRLVRALVEELRPAGRHTITWDGRDDERGSVPAGVYFVRLRAADFTATQKVVRLK